MKQRAISLILTGFVGIGSQLASAEGLREVYELALQNDPALKAAEATYRANIETEKLARSALLPQVYGSAEYKTSDMDVSNTGVSYTSSGALGTTSPTVVTTDLESTSDETTYAVSLNQKIFDVAAWFNFRSGKSITKQAEAQLAADQQDEIIRVAQAYFSVLRAYENLEASRAEERAAKRQLEQTQQRFDVGLIAITDVHEAHAVYDNTVAQRLGFEAALGTAYEALSVLTGRIHQNLPNLSKNFPISNPEPTDLGQWVTFALSNNYQLKAAIYATEAARNAAKAKKASHLPTITGSFSYSDYEKDGEQDFSSTTWPDDLESDGTVASLNLSVPLFAGGGISASRRQAYEQYNAALQGKINTQRQVVQQTRSLHLTVSTDVQRVKARKQNIVSAQSALDATKAGYDVGTRNIVDVLQSQRALYAAIRDYANARFDYVLNMLKLKQQAGLLSPEDINNLDKWLTTENAEPKK